MGEMHGMVAGPLFQVKRWIEPVGAEHCGVFWGQEYLGMLDANSAIVRGPIEINAADCLIVIDMQNDFVSAAPDNPVESPPFGVLLPRSQPAHLCLLAHL